MTLERALAERWEEQNRRDDGTSLDEILARLMERQPTAAEAEAAATAVQWLGTNIGRWWLDMALHAAGYKMLAPFEVTRMDKVAEAEQKVMLEAMQLSTEKRVWEERIKKLVTDGTAEDEIARLRQMEDAARETRLLIEEGLEALERDRLEQTKIEHYFAKALMNLDSPVVQDEDEPAY